MAKAALWLVTDAEARKRGEQTGLDTLVAVSYTHLDVYKRQLKALNAKNPVTITKNVDTIIMVQFC